MGEVGGKKTAAGQGSVAALTSAATARIDSREKTRECLTLEAVVEEGKLGVLGEDAGESGGEEWRDVLEGTRSCRSWRIS